MRLLERENMALPLLVQADLLSVSRASLYYQPAPPDTTEVRLKRRIDEIYTESPFYGARKIAEQLQQEGHSCCRITARKYMQQMGIEAIRPRPNLSQRNQEHKVYPYLLRGMRIEHPNAVWGTDITYIRLTNGWMYLVAFLDWFSRYVVAWELSDSLELPFVLSCADVALAQARPEIVNSDQGSHFTSPRFTDRFLAVEARISMDGRGRCMDNIFTERLWRSVKYEEVYLNEYNSPREARAGISRYMEFYNYRRIHQALGYRTPAAVYANPRLLTKIDQTKGQEPTLN
jgi:putative transposase